MQVQELQRKKPTAEIRKLIAVAEAEILRRQRTRSMLLHAYEMRNLVVLFDGIDEAAGLREQMENFILYELTPMGIRVCMSLARRAAEGFSALD